MRARVDANLDAEQRAAGQGQRIFAPIAAAVKRVARRCVGRAHLRLREGAVRFRLEAHHAAGQQAGVASTSSTRYRSFGYEPEYQWFEYRARALGGKTANVIATLKGTEQSRAVYVVSSHYDSVAIGPGADDDTSGTAALLETARVLAKHPQPATIIFASFTGEEAGTARQPRVRAARGQPTGCRSSAR